MFNIIQRRYLYFTLSAIIIIPGLIAMIISTVQYGAPFRLSIDFTGGAMQELRFDQPVEPGEIRQIFIDRG